MSETVRGLIRSKNKWVFNKLENMPELVDKTTIGQETKHFDRYGLPLYVGDIILSYYAPNYPRFKYNTNLFIIKEKKGNIIISDVINRYDLPPERVAISTLIGNIHEGELSELIRLYQIRNTQYETMRYRGLNGSLSVSASDSLEKTLMQMGVIRRKIIEVIRRRK